MSQVSYKKLVKRTLYKVTCSVFVLCSTLLPGFAHSEYAEEGKFYPNPGIVAFREGRWVGSDHLYNITDRIDIAVEINKPPKVVLPVTEAMIRSRIADIFKKAKIHPVADSLPGKPPLPFFHVLLMIYPIEKGYVAYCEGRLLEQIKVDRVRLDEQTVMQGITWETENLIIIPSDELTDQLYSIVDDIANTFVERYQFYESIKSQIKSR